MAESERRVSRLVGEVRRLADVIEAAERDGERLHLSPHEVRLLSAAMVEIAERRQQREGS